jgi:hypothetical protein
MRISAMNGCMQIGGTSLMLHLGVFTLVGILSGEMSLNHPLIPSALPIPVFHCDACNYLGHSMCSAHTSFETASITLIGVLTQY